MVPDLTHQATGSDDAVRYSRAVTLLEAEIDSELVALDEAGGQCFGFNEVATDVWRLLHKPRSFHEIRAALLEAYEVDPVQCSEELEELLTDLCARGLVSKTAI